MAEHLYGGLLSQLPKSVRSSMAFFSFLRDTVIERYPDEESVNRHIEGERKYLQKTVWLLEHHLGDLSHGYQYTQVGGATCIIDVTFCCWC